MSIRLVNGCVNCENLANDNTCKVHHEKVKEIHTCDSFDMRVSLKDEVECGTCIKFSTPRCPNQANAVHGMLCNEWAPKANA
ncbi:hypothetical protein KRX57_02815 [Weeksellaceae bacterium TAE3-ERU29]|nr:hypothetical protein [Weeksellaceae bacterium TAE3-ERU29]